MTLRILNCYSGIGGNRKFWSGDIEVTAIENDERIARIYQSFFPQDKVLVCDAHKYLLEHYSEFDFIWSSPPCPSHSNNNNFLNAQGVVRYPDMQLYQEIILLTHFFSGLFVVENVVSYYEPLIKPFRCERHFFWSNFIIPSRPYSRDACVTNARGSTRRDSEVFLRDLERLHGFDLSGVDGSLAFKSKLLANCVRPELGLYVFNCAYKDKQSTLE